MLLVHLKLLGLALVLINQLLLVVDLLSSFRSGVGHALVLEVSDRALALGNHLSDRLALHSLVVRILHVELLLAAKVLLQLLLNIRGTLHLGDVHVVAGVLHLLAALLLSFEGLVPTFTFLLLSHLSLHLLLHGENKNHKCTVSACTISNVTDISNSRCLNFKYGAADTKRQQKHDRNINLLS